MEIKTVTSQIIMVIVSLVLLIGTGAYVLLNETGGDIVVTLGNPVPSIIILFIDFLFACVFIGLIFYFSYRKSLRLKRRNNERKTRRCAEIGKRICRNPGSEKRGREYLVPSR